MEEVCSGASSAVCPPDAFEPDTLVCRWARMKGGAGTDGNTGWSARVFVTHGTRHVCRSVCMHVASSVKRQATHALSCSACVRANDRMLLPVQERD
jgi:hypothetical protein